jgi:NADH-quinone oxidoreductase subunit J
VTLELFFFYVYAAVALAGALGLVLAKRLAHSLMSVFATLLAVAALFLLLDAEFLAAMQLFVYGGAVTILMLFALMLSGDAAEAEEKLTPAVAWMAGVVCVAFFAMLVLTIGWADWPLAPNQQIDTAAIATILFSKYIVPFEIAGLALTVALIGAIVMSRDGDHSANAPADEGGGEA